MSELERGRARSELLELVRDALARNVLSERERRQALHELLQLERQRLLYVLEQRAADLDEQAWRVGFRTPLLRRLLKPAWLLELAAARARELLRLRELERETRRKGHR